MAIPTTLIDANDLAALDPGQVLIVDCRFDLADPALGQRLFSEAHLPGAVYASLDNDLSDLSLTPQGLGRHPLPLAEDFSHTLGRWGWHPALRVVTYDAGSGALAAARLWWLLRLAGIEHVAVLNGGFATWQSAGLPLETAPAPRKPTQVSVEYRNDLLALAPAMADQAWQGRLLDARAAPRYRGEVEPLDRVAGHVPGARNRPYTENLGSDGRFKLAEQLRAEFGQLLGDTPPESIIHMCGSGVTACHNLLAMEHAGLHGSRLYAPSWSGWVSDARQGAVARGE